VAFPFSSLLLGFEGCGDDGRVCLLRLIDMHARSSSSSLARRACASVIPLASAFTSNNGALPKALLLSLATFSEAYSNQHLALGGNTSSPPPSSTLPSFPSPPPAHPISSPSPPPSYPTRHRRRRHNKLPCLQHSASKQRRYYRPWGKAGGRVGRREEG